MPVVRLTKPQISILLSIAGEVTASSPKEWGDTRGEKEPEAIRHWDTLNRATNRLAEALLPRRRTPA